MTKYHIVAKEHRRAFQNFDREITNRIHLVSFVLKGGEGEGFRYEYDKAETASVSIIWAEAWNNSSITQTEG